MESRQKDRWTDGRLRVLEIYNWVSMTEVVEKAETSCEKQPGGEGGDLKSGLCK